MPRTATVKATTKLTTLRISKDLFFRLVTEFPQMSVEIMRELAHRLEKTTTQLRAAEERPGRNLSTDSPGQSSPDEPGMSRLESFIRRLVAQRDCLDAAAA